MIITKLILENINGLDTGMGVRKLTIDFPINDNKIYLLTAPNGTGKTTLLSLMTPFASLGNIDVRDGYNLIIPGENGYKEIHIKNNRDLYIIKHYYTWSASRGNWTVKSYIEKNGDELNENGNVTSFKELVSIELDLELDYLKLTRLGSNVASLLQSSETERKNYMSRLLDDVDIYLKFYKKVNADVSELKTMITHSNTKLVKLGITDYHESKKQLKRIRKEIEELEEERAKIISDLGVCNKSISDIGDYTEIETKWSDTLKKSKKMRKIIDNRGDVFKDVVIYRGEISSLEKRLSELTINKAVVTNQLDNLIVTRDSLSKILEDEEIRINKDKHVMDEINSLLEISDQYVDDIKEYKRNLKGFNPVTTEDDFKEFVRFLYTHQKNASKVYEHGELVTAEAVRIYTSGDDIQLWINRNLSKLQREGSDEIVQFISKRLDNHGLLHNRVHCDSNCANEKFVDEMREFVITESSKEDPINIQDFVYAVLGAYNNLVNMMNDFDEKKKFISSLPNNMKDDLSKKNILKRYSSTELLFTESFYSQYASLLRELSILSETEQKKLDIDEKIGNLKRYNIDSIVIESHEKHQEEYDACKDTIRETRLTLGHIVEEITESTKSLDSLNDELETVTNYQTVKEELQSLTDTIEKYNLLSNEQNDLMDKEKRIRFSIESNRKMERDLESKLDQYKAIQKELDTYSMHYDNMILVKESLSSRKGMPLYYIKMYLDDTKDVTNRLLDIVYDGNIQLDDFILSPSSFSIPFINRGKVVKDVKYASQGEQAFLSIALSFALSARALTKYNIMLLDEIDATLDINNREKFLEIIETYTDMIKSEQCILISHSGAFNYCPINLIDLSDSTDEELIKKYPLATLVDVKKD